MIKKSLQALYMGLAAFPPGSDENEAILDALKKLSKVFGSPAKEQAPPGARPPMPSPVAPGMAPPGAAPQQPPAEM
jgi:hypothetical protein